MRLLSILSTFSFHLAALGFEPIFGAINRTGLKVKLAIVLANKILK